GVGASAARPYGAFHGFRLPSHNGSRRDLRGGFRPRQRLRRCYAILRTSISFRVSESDSSLKASSAFSMIFLRNSESLRNCSERITARIRSPANRSPAAGSSFRTSINTLFQKFRSDVLV